MNIEDMKGPFIVKGEGTDILIATDAQNAVKTATHMAISKHISVGIFALVKTIRVESKVITEDSDGTQSEITV